MAAKVFFVLLVLVGVVFYFTLFAGAQRNDSDALPPSDDARQKYAEDHPPPPWISGMIGSLSPKLKLPKGEFRFGPAELVVDLPASDSRFRNATLRVIEGCRAPTDCSNIVIRYHSKGGEGRDLKLDEQSWRPYKDKPDQASLVVLQAGGTLTLQCIQMVSCTAELVE